jgi:hypothetical protein
MDGQAGVLLPEAGDGAADEGGDSHASALGGSGW